MRFSHLPLVFGGVVYAVSTLGDAGKYHIRLGPKAGSIQTISIFTNTRHASQVFLEVMVEHTENWALINGFRPELDPWRREEQLGTAIVAAWTKTLPTRQHTAPRNGALPKAIKVSPLAIDLLSATVANKEEMTLRAAIQAVLARSSTTGAFVVENPDRSASDAGSRAIQRENKGKWELLATGPFYDAAVSVAEKMNIRSGVESITYGVETDFCRECLVYRLR